MHRWPMLFARVRGRFGLVIGLTFSVAGLSLQPVTALAANNFLTWTKSAATSTDWEFQPACITATTCFVAGTTRDVNGNSGDGTIHRSTDGGSTWESTNEAVVTPGTTLSGLTCIRGTSTCIAVGLGGLILRTINAKSAAPAWIKVTDPNTDDLYSVACVNTTICYAVGGIGKIVRSANGGMTWASVVTPNKNLMFSVACGGGTRCVAAGWKGEIMSVKRADRAPATNPWLLQSAKVGATVYTGGIYGVACGSSLFCVAASDSGKLLSTQNGGSTSWKVTTTGATRPFTGVGCLDNQTCMAVGVGGTIYSTLDAAATWDTEASPTTNELDGIWCDPVNTFCIGSGENGTLVNGV